MLPGIIPPVIAILGTVVGIERPVPIGKNGPAPPVAVIDVCQCTVGGVATDITDIDDPNTTPRDTCLSGSSLQVQWHAEGGPVNGWRYKLEESPELSPPVPFTEVPSGVRSVTYDAASLHSGTWVFTLQAVGPKSASDLLTRRFKLNFSPDTWFSGPDPNSPLLSTKPNGERYVLLVNGSPPDFAGSLLSPDSTEVLPLSRGARRTFFEIWKDTVFVRQEGDTLHLNSWALFHNGGSDRDSPYSVKVSDAARLLPGFPGGPVLDPGPPNGSPIGFRSIVTFSLTPNGAPSRSALSGLYPIYDPNSVFHLPRIGGYAQLFLAGRAFAVQQAEDGDGDRDKRVQDGRALVLAIENGTATPYELHLRPLVMAFHVDKPPSFVANSPLFHPQPQETFTTALWNLRLIGTDEDPFIPGTPPGGPSASMTLRRRITVKGLDAQGNPVTYEDPTPHFQESVVVSVPAALAAGPCAVEVQLCDCEACEQFPGSGRCIVQSFPVNYQPSGQAAGSGADAMRSTTEAGPDRTLLFAPYPNPASGRVSLRFQLASRGPAELVLFNLAGQRVRQLVKEELPAGEHSRIWDGADEAGRPVAPGVYLVRFRASDGQWTRKVFVAR